MSGIPFTLAAVSRDLHGIVSLDELHALGISKSQRHQLIVDGLLVPMFRGVYRLATCHESLAGRCRAICLANPDAVITGRAAGRLWGLRRMGPVDTIEVRLPHGSRSFGDPRIVERRCNQLPAMDVVSRSDGIRVVSPPRLCFDLSSVLPPLDLESVVDQVLDRGTCSLGFLVDTGLRLYHSRRPGSRQFRALMRSRPQWREAADSHQEVTLRDALHSAGVAGLQIQYAVELDAQITVHLDLAVPRINWGIEIDHYDFHGGRTALQRDKRRDRMLAALGWQISRVTDDDFGERLPTTITELMAIYRGLHLSPSAS